MSDLPADVREILEKILQKDPQLLTQYEINFLNGRRWALNSEQKRIYASVLLPDELPDGGKNVQVPQSQIHATPAQPPTTTAPAIPATPATPPQNLPPANTQYSEPTPPPAPESTPVQPEQVSPVEPTQPTTEPSNPFDVDPSKFDPAA